MKIDTCIVGAGIAGLCAAMRLVNNDRRVVILDKGKGVGGRMSVRRFASGLFDHGAQFFSIKDPKFASIVEEWEKQGLVDHWSDGFKKVGGNDVNKNQPYYRGVTGMNAIAKHLAQGLDIRTQTNTTQIRYDKGNWRIFTENGESIEAHSVIMTPPVPQALEILKKTNFKIPSYDYAVLNRVSYDPCIALLLILEGKSNVPEPGGMFGSGEPIQWIADNNLKGISSDALAVTIHAGPAFSREHWQTADSTIKHLLVDSAWQWLGSEISQYQIHRWRYSKPVKTYPEPCYVMEAPASLILAGDAFGGPRVEGAALSGLAAAEKLIGY